MLLRDVLRMLFGDFFDVDATHVGEDHDRALRDAVPGDPQVVLLRHGLAALDQHPPRLVPVDLEPEDLLSSHCRFVGGVGKEHAAGLHASARKHLALQDRRAHDRGRNLARLGRGLRKLRALRQGHAMTRQ